MNSLAQQLEALFTEYVETLDNSDSVEYYQTAKELAQAELSGFLEWLKSRP